MDWLSHEENQSGQVALRGGLRGGRGVGGSSQWAGWHFKVMNGNNINRSAME
jgi:hypothetical protein